MKKVLATAAVIGAMISTPAMAWGDREQGALAGIVGTLILQEIYRDNQGSYPQQQPRYPQQQPQVIEHHHHYGNRNCGIEIRTVWTDNYRREIRSEHDRCTGALLRRTEIIHQR